MKKSAGLGLFFFFLVPFLPSGWAHGNDFHSLSELQSHISSHLTGLRNLEQQNSAGKIQIQEECREIQIHARQYQEFAGKLIASGKSVQIACLLDKISGELYRAAGLGDFPRAVEIMAELKNLLRRPV